MIFTHFRPMFHFYTPEKYQKPFGFMTFPWNMEMVHWTNKLLRMDYKVGKSGDQFDHTSPSLYYFPKCILQRKGGTLLFCDIWYYHKLHFLLKIPLIDEVIWKIWRFYSSILTILSSFRIFLHFFVAKKLMTSDIIDDISKFLALTYSDRVKKHQRQFDVILTNYRFLGIFWDVLINI